MKRSFIALLLASLVGLTTTAPLAAQKQAIKRTVTQDSVTPDAPTDPNSIHLVIDAPTKVKAGDLVVLSVEESNAASFEWIVLPSTDNFLVIDQGRRAVFSCGEAGEFIFIVAAAKGDQVSVLYHKLVVTGPVKPADGIGSVVVALCDKIESPTKRDDLLKLSQSFASVAAMVEQAKDMTPVDIARATRTSNQTALGDKLDNWEPFAKGLARALLEMSKTGKLTTTEDHITVWNRISTALRDYAEKLE